MSVGQSAGEIWGTVSTLQVNLGTTVDQQAAGPPPVVLDIAWFEKVRTFQSTVGIDEWYGKIA